MSARKLIVNADDYGPSALAVDSIIKSHRDGIVTSTSIIGNIGKLEYAIHRLKEFPNLKVGVHLVCTSGKPVLDPSMVPSLVDERGNFWGQRDFLARMDQIKPQELMLEFEAQIERINSFGLPTKQLTHVDNHHPAIYYAPHLYEVVLKLAQKLELPTRIPFGERYYKIRSKINETLPISEMQAIDAEKKVLNLLRKYKPAGPDYFFPDFTMFDGSKEHLIELLSKLPEGVSELVCHPTWGHSRGWKESEVLTDPEIKAEIKNQGIELVSYENAFLP